MQRIKKNGLSKKRKSVFVAYKRNWRALNHEKINQDYRLKIMTDESFRLRKNVSRAINNAIKNNFGKKYGSITQYLSYSMNDLKNHLEARFDSKMSWKNYGIYWHIDHIIPQSDLPFTSMTENNFNKCWALSNLRPLEAKQNMSEGASRIRHNKMEKLNA